MKEDQRLENYRIYYQTQYDRIDKLETKRENFSNYVIGISSGIFLIAAGNPEKIQSLEIAIIVFYFLLIVNVISIMFIVKTLPLIKMHQDRAKKVKIIFNSEIFNIEQSVYKPESIYYFFKFKFEFKRHALYILLHVVIVLFFALLALSIFQSDKKINESIKVEITKGSS